MRDLEKLLKRFAEQEAKLMRMQFLAPTTGSGGKVQNAVKSCLDAPTALERLERFNNFFRSQKLLALRQKKPSLASYFSPMSARNGRSESGKGCPLKRNSNFWRNGRCDINYHCSERNWSVSSSKEKTTSFVGVMVAVNT